MCPATAKPIALVKGHRTNAEKELRQTAEEELMSGLELSESDEVKNNKVAHKEFLRLKRLFSNIKKDDDLNGDTINVFCLLVAECKELELLRNGTIKEVEALERKYNDNAIEFLDFLDRKNKLMDKYLAYDKKIMDKRKMRNDISKENLMTLASAMRSIPKVPPKDDDDEFGSYVKKE